MCKFNRANANLTGECKFNSTMQIKHDQDEFKRKSANIKKIAKLIG